MKQVIIAFVVVLIIILGNMWLNGKLGKLQKKEDLKIESDRVLYLIPNETAKIGEEKEYKLMAKGKEVKVNSFNVDLLYDSGMVSIAKIEINKEVFDQMVLESVSEEFGKVRIGGKSTKKEADLATGEVELATITIKGKKKGTMIVESAARPMIQIWQNGAIVDGSFSWDDSRLMVE